MSDASFNAALHRLRPGQKLILTGGGGIANEFKIVSFVEVLRDARRGNDVDSAAQVRIRERDRLSGRLHTFDPILYSWHLSTVVSLSRLPLGTYIVGSDGEIRNASKLGMFGTIYDAPVVIKGKSRVRE